MPIRRPLFDEHNDFPGKDDKRVLSVVKCVREVIHDRTLAPCKGISGLKIPKVGKTYRVRGLQYDPQNGLGLLLEGINNLPAEKHSEEPSWPLYFFDRTYEEGELELGEIASSGY